MDSSIVFSDRNYEDARYLVIDNASSLPKSPALNPEDGSFRGLPALNSNRQIDESILSSKKPILTYFYTHPGHLLSIDRPNFNLFIDPIIHFTYGKEQSEGNLLDNTRGVQIRGHIDQKVFFYSRILETQSRFPSYINRFVNRYKTIPGNNLYKTYNSDIFNIENGYDYLNADAYVGFNLTKHIGTQLGYGSHFIGNGIRSLFLSNFANNLFYLKFNTRVWKFHYQNLFGEINSESANIRGDALVPKKYFAAHYLGINLHKNVQVGIFETVVFGREQFEFQYLNPIIFYRSVEHNLGSPDNVLIGLDIKWNIFQRMSIYSQLLLDEFKLNELTAGTGWWANKYAFQLGFKYIDVANIDHLDIQVEYNAIRPYTYSHSDSLANYSHYFQSLAHPLGANFKEVLFQIRYVPWKRVTTTFRYWNALRGEDENSTNYGSNILLPNSTRRQDFDNFIGQGIENSINQWQLSLSYQLFHNVLLEFDLSQRSEQIVPNTSLFFQTGIRMNFNTPNRFY